MFAMQIVPSVTQDVRVAMPERSETGSSRGLAHRVVADLQRAEDTGCLGAFRRLNQLADRGRAEEDTAVVKEDPRCGAIVGIVPAYYNGAPRVALS
jgi:hypothetical protein